MTTRPPDYLPDNPVAVQRETDEAVAQRAMDAAIKATPATVDVMAIAKGVVEVMVILAPFTPDERWRITEGAKAMLGMKPPVVYRESPSPSPYYPRRVGK